MKMIYIDHDFERISFLLSFVILELIDFLGVEGIHRHDPGIIDCLGYYNLLKHLLNLPLNQSE